MMPPERLPFEQIEMRRIDREAAETELERAKADVRKAMARLRAAEEKLRILNEPLVRAYTSQVSKTDDTRVMW